jgi:uncharacterized protein YqjF (DUF2071 family)
MHPALNFVAHRPWPLPPGPWVMVQSWHDLLFAHWPVAPGQIRRVVPAELPIDTFGGAAWVGVVPFWMSNVRPRGVPRLPGLSRFPELNVRTYVSAGGKPGVYFFSLDAARLLAVMAARAFYHLPYFHARISVEAEGDQVNYESRRVNGNASLRAHYAPVSPIEYPRPGTLEHWLTERYCLYTVVRGKVFRGEIHHGQWPLQNASAEFEFNSMAASAGIELPPAKPLLHFSRRQDVLIWPLRAAL